MTFPDIPGSSAHGATVPIFEIGTDSEERISYLGYTKRLENDIGNWNCNERSGQ